MLHRSDTYAKRFSHLVATTSAPGRGKDKDVASLVPGSSQVQAGYIKQLQPLKREQQSEHEPVSRHAHQVTPSTHATTAIQKLLAASSSAPPPAPRRAVDLATAPASGARGFVYTRFEREPSTLCLSNAYVCFLF
jgi:hypothetical protein